jgi:hypothetical protein
LLSSDHVTQDDKQSPHISFYFIQQTTTSTTHACYAPHRIHHTDIHTTMPDLSKHCDALTAPNPFTVSLAGFLVFGILVSYIPQHTKIIQRRSSEGLSPWWVLLGGLSSIAATGNILTLPASRADIGCCKELNGTECAAALLGVAQIGIQWSCFMFM